jgi:UDP-N-acetylmuramate dehydrogenase
MDVKEHISLKAYNTFGVDVPARWLTEVHSLAAVQEVAAYLRKHDEVPLLVLGGGSNVLFRKPVNALVMLNRIRGIDLLSEDEDSVLVRVGAGEGWHDFVEHCIAKNWAGVENLALIPGMVGAGPMQNIGAYGVELVSVFEFLEAVHLATGEIHRFSKSECRFGYRESIFKNEVKGEYVITHVTFRLNKQPNFTTSYGAIAQELERMQVATLSLRAVADAVIAIRQSKLPDPRVLGNAGSFFKNPVVSASFFEGFSAEWPDAPNYQAADGIKLAAGWLIERAGWKGYRTERCGVHDRQALVLVNFGNASGQEIYDLSTQIVNDVEQRFGVTLEREVNIL